MTSAKRVAAASAASKRHAPAASRSIGLILRIDHDRTDPLFVRRDRAMEPTARALELAGPIHGALADISRTLTLPGAFDPATVRRHT